MKILFSLTCLIITLILSSVTSNGQNIPTFNNWPIINSMNSDSVINEKSGWHYFFMNDKTETGWYLKMSYVLPHQRRHGTHSHSVDEFIFILEGTAEVTINDSIYIAQSNTSIYYPVGSIHGLRNIDSIPLKYLVIKKNLVNTPKSQ